MKKETDDYDWATYTKSYTDQMNRSVIKNRDLLITGFTIKDDDITFKGNLHPNWQEIYYQVINKKVASVCECGCGSGQHLVNIHTIAPDIDIEGCDLLQTQIDYGKTLFTIPQKLLNNIKILDFSQPGAYKSFEHTFDLVYTQAVTMHLKHDKAVNFIKNMIQLSNKYVLLVENPTAHDYGALIKDVCEELCVSTTRIKTSRYIKHGILISKEV